jgi:hypothetical protein
MPTSQSSTFVTQWAERFRRNLLASSVIAGLREQGDEIWRRALSQLQRESPEYRNAVDGELIERSKIHYESIRQTILAIAANLTTKGVDPFDFVREHAQWRVRHQMPLVREQRAYRTAHRIYRESTQESLLGHAEQGEAIVSLVMLSNFWIEFFDHLATVLTEAHVAEEGMIAARGSRTFVDLMDDLLRGREPIGAEANRLFALCGMQFGAPLAVAVVRPLQSGHGNQIDLEAMLRSLVRLLEQVLGAACFGRIIDIRNAEVMVIAGGVAKPARSMLEALCRHGFRQEAASGLAALRGGISADAFEIARLPQALEEAKTALELASDAQPILHFSDIELPEFLIRHADRAAVRLIPQWACHFNSADDARTRQLVQTIRVFADGNFNVKETARRLGVHPNTVYWRLNRIEKLTGIDPRTYSGTSLFLTVLRLLEVQRDSKTS